MKANLISTLRRVALVLAACACATAARAATFTVTTAADEFDTPSGAAVSLREAVRDAATAGGADTITFAPALSGGTITLTSEIVIDSEVTIDASSLPGGLTISGNNVTLIFNVGSGQSLALLGLTLTGGNGSQSNFSGPGGAILNYGGTLTLTLCTLSGNTVISNSGGAIGNFNGTVTLTQCTLSGNSGGLGGAISNSGGTLTLRHCTLSGNSASLSGGAIQNWGTLTQAYSIVAGNTAPPNHGADIYNNGVSGPATVTRVGANLVQSLVNANGGTDSGPAAINALPLLAPLAAYGGPTQTMALLPGSPARNAAVGSLATSDQRGFPLVGLPDIGAYEAGTFGDFDAWAIETTGTALAFTVDGEKDGAVNGLEYALRRDPATSDTPLSPTLTGPAGAHLFTFRYRAAARDLRYIVQRSTDLTNGNGWLEIYRFDASTGVITETGVTGDENAGTEVITLTDPASGAKVFWRLRIEQVP